MHTCIHTYVYIYIRTYANTYGCMCVYYTHTHTHTHTHTTHKQVSMTVPLRNPGCQKGIVACAASIAIGNGMESARCSLRRVAFRAVLNRAAGSDDPQTPDLRPALASQREFIRERRVRLFIMQHTPRAPTKPKLSEAG
jgi:hypothetical protein